MSGYVIIQAPLTEVHPAPWQPESRTATSTALIALRKSIQEKNLQYPPLVTRDADGNGFTIVDGHRRYACCKALAWQTMPVLVSNGVGKDLFAAVSGTTKPMTAIQWVEVYLAGGTLPGGPNATCITKLEELKGKDFLTRLVESNVSPQIWNVANRVVNYLHCAVDQKPAILDWLIAHKLSREVSLWITQGDSIEELELALQQNRRPKTT